MVAGERTTNAALLRYRAGLVLIWIGVLAWQPFLVLRASGYKPSLFGFLPFHLVGVIGGSRMRKAAREAFPRIDTVYLSYSHNIKMNLSLHIF